MKDHNAHLPYYTIPKKIRELQQANQANIFQKDYTIPKKIRELKQGRVDLGSEFKK